MALYLRLLSYVKPYRTQLTFALLCMGVVSATEGAKALIVKPVLDDIFIGKDIRMLSILPVAVVLIYIAQGVFRYLSAYIMNYVGQLVVKIIRNDLYACIQTFSLSFFKNHPTGMLMSRILNDVNLMQHSVSNVVTEIARESMKIVALMVVVFYRDWSMALISLSVMPLSVYFLTRFGQRLRELSERGQEEMAGLSNVLQETFSGARLIKAFNMEGMEIERFNRENERYFGVVRKTIKYIELSSPVQEVIGSLGVALIIWYGGSRVLNGVKTPGEFFSFLTALILLYQPIRKLTRMNNVLQQALAAAERVFHIMDLKPTVMEREGAVELKEFTSRIEFKDVSFSYDSQAVLEGISFRAEKGEKVAIVGMSGVGKTTLVDLVPRFYDVTSGSIEMDGCDVRDLTIPSLRRLIGIVSQDVFFFNDTIRNNIAYGKEDAKEEEIVGAARAAFAHQFIEEMADGYDTVIKERGVRLSGGQRQRIAIARAILRNPSILILDEATSALDSESEQIVQNALHNLMADKTTFIIAHRLSTIVSADKIILLDNGRIRRIGTHKDLLEHDDLYKRLYSTQFTDDGKLR